MCWGGLSRCNFEFPAVVSASSLGLQVLVARTVINPINEVLTWRDPLCVWHRINPLFPTGLNLLQLGSHSESSSSSMG